ncbi:loganic acid O-methyltransferase-like [Salvia miltiorrhiza]|uniref:loganic acid O-methyltransferase-like n=1 Tax=Salvia miltiorrhiza TaxID=226208 RepID=UPI0025AD9B79|nr:loganic acid O-methyltransferase-like [Salvia miltiorrhiza]
MADGEAFPMNGGDGTHSYSKNSQYQKLASDAVKETIQEAVIENLDTESMSSTVTIADLGCSVGPNTFLAVENLMEAVEAKRGSKNDLEFQVFFNDHSANDFNTLFASLPADRQYHAAGVPGSFHGRLFPRNSITLAHSSYSLQWLSKPPQGVANEGRIHNSGASEDVVRAYSDQYEKDLGVFMSARAEEIVRGGLLILVVPATPDGVSHSLLPIGVLLTYLGYALMELANEGVVDKCKIDGFNLPIYYPTQGELRRLIEKNGRFSIEKMELSYPFAQLTTEINAAPLIMQLRVTIEGLLTTYFGISVVEKVFSKMLAKTEEISMHFKAGHDQTQLLLALKRK